MPYVTEDNLTDVVLEHWKDILNPRLRQIMQSLIKHLHGFVRDIEATQAEFARAIDWLTHTGKLGRLVDITLRPTVALEVADTAAPIRGGPTLLGNRPVSTPAWKSWSRSSSPLARKSAWTQPHANTPDAKARGRDKHPQITWITQI
jgi:catechol 2,3-dioxygenase-like protein